MVTTNEYGQPVGEIVTGWCGVDAPDGRTLSGRTVLVERLDPNRHAAPLHEALADAPPGHWTYLPYGPFADATACRAWIDALATAPNAVFHAICSPDGSPLGVAAYLNISTADGSVEVGGITYGTALQRTVAATEAMYLLMAHAFDDLGYRRYEWKCDALNAPSRAAALRLGFVFEGEFANHRVVRGRRRDTAWFAVTEQRWRDSVGPALRSWLAPDNHIDGRQRRRLEQLRP